MDNPIFNTAARRVLSFTWLLMHIFGAANAQCIGTVAGEVPEVGGSALDTDFEQLTAVASDGWGNIYFADFTRVYRVSAMDNSIALVAGTGSFAVAGIQLNGGKVEDMDGPAISTPLNSPIGLAIDANFSVYVSESFAVRKVNFEDGMMTRVAGSSRGVMSDDIAATDAMIFEPYSVKLDSDGNVYFVERMWPRLRKVTKATGIITTVAGSAVEGFDGDGGPASSALFNKPEGLALDAFGNFYISDTANNRIRKIWADGNITTIAGNGTAGWGGDGGLATAAMLNGPAGLVVTPAGHIYFADKQNHIIRKIDASSGIITTVVGTRATNFNGDRLPGTATNLNLPADVAMLPSGDIALVEAGNRRVRIYDTKTGIVAIIAGRGTTGAAPAYTSRFVNPTAVAFDKVHTMYVIETDLNRIRKVNATTGVLSTLIGDSTSGAAQQGTGTVDADPVVTTTEAARLCRPASLVVDANNNIYFSESCGHVVRRITAGTNIVTTVVGVPGVNGYNGDDQPASSAYLADPAGLAFDDSGALYIADASNRRVRMVVDGVITTFAGTGDSPFAGDGPATSAQMSYPAAVAIDAGGRVFIADTGEGFVYMVQGGALTKFAGAAYGTHMVGENIPATSALLVGITGIAITSDYTVYLSDAYNQKILRVQSDYVTTFAGRGSSGFSGDGGLPTVAALANPRGVAVDAFNNIYFADSSNGRVRAVVMSQEIACPVGASCRCASPVPCKNATSYCPGMRAEASTVVQGYYSEPTITTFGTVYARQRPCPVGSYCVGGLQLPCSAGSYGTVGLQVSPLACKACPVGRYSHEAGLVAPADPSSACIACPGGMYAPHPGSGFCMPCPPGTFAAAGSNAACTPCTNGTSSVAGSEHCFPVVGLERAVESMLTVELVQPPPATGTSSTKLLFLQAAVAIPIGVAFSIPLLLVLALYCCDERRCMRRWLFAALTKADMYALNHKIQQGQSPVFKKTALGGAMTFAAVGVIGALAASLIVQYRENNGLLQRSILPAPLPSLLGFADIRPHTLLSDVALLPGLVQGVAVQILAAGPFCGAITVASDAQLASGTFTVTSRPTASLNQHVHTISCPDCLFGSLSNFDVRLDGSCQSLVVTAGAVNVHGGLSIKSFSATSSRDILKGEVSRLARVDVSFTPTLSVFHDFIRGEKQRGTSLAVEVPQFTYTDAEPSQVQLHMQFVGSSDYVNVEIGPILTISQLLSNIIGLFGLLGGFGIAFSMLENLLPSKQHQFDAHGKIITAAPSPSSAKSGNGCTVKDEAGNSIYGYYKSEVGRAPAAAKASDDPAMSPTGTAPPALQQVPAATSDMPVVLGVRHDGDHHNTVNAADKSPHVE